jgi:hypothetical protein
MNGCRCNAGWHGQFCEVPDSCAGVMTAADKCCASGVLDVHGACCDEGAVLDSWGACCAAGQVDKCGKCGGSSWTVDITVSGAGWVERLFASCRVDLLAAAMHTLVQLCGSSSQLQIGCMIG